MKTPKKSAQFDPTAEFLERIKGAFLYEEDDDYWYFNPIVHPNPDNYYKSWQLRAIADELDRRNRKVDIKAMAIWNKKYAKQA